jgi:hypothetical protein
MEPHDPHHADVDDPFADPIPNDGHQRILSGEPTLNVSRNASLTLGTDSLIVLGRLLHFLISQALTLMLTL